MDDKDKIFSTIKKRYQYASIVLKARMKSVHYNGRPESRDNPTMISDKISIINRTDLDVYCIDKMGFFHSAYKPDKQTTNYITIEKEIYFDGLNNKIRYFSILKKLGNLADLDLEKMTNSELVMLNYIYYCTRNDNIVRERNIRKNEGNGGVLSKNRLEGNDDVIYNSSKLDTNVKLDEMISIIKGGYFSNPGSLLFTVEFQIHKDEIKKYDNIVYLKELGIILTIDEDLADHQNHPDFDELHYQIEREDKMKMSGMVGYIIDRKNVIGDKYVIHNGSVVKVKVNKDYTGDLSDGLYIEKYDVVNPNNRKEVIPMVRTYFDETDMEKCDVIFSSAADAFASDGYKAIVKNNETIAALELKIAELELQRVKVAAMTVKNNFEVKSYSREEELNKMKYEIEKTKLAAVSIKGTGDLFSSILGVLSLFIPIFGKK